MQTDAIPSSRHDDFWPALPYEEWKDTLATLHMWLQIVGKIRLVSMPWINHSWHVALQPTACGLTTLRMPHGERTYQIDFDFIAHELVIVTDDGARRTLALGPRTVADFYHELFSSLDALGLHVRINTTPNEVTEAIPFEQDKVHASYDRKYADRFRRALLQADRVFHAFRSRFIGKCSPVHFFWGATDLAVTRFSGQKAPPHPAGVPHCPDWVMREAYSHQLSSCGFWPGGEMMSEPVFYAYAYPEPDGFSAAKVRPGEAYYHSTLREFVLPYEAVRQADAPDAMLLDFLQDCYEAAATLGGWDRSALERMWPLK